MALNIYAGRLLDQFGNMAEVPFTSYRVVDLDQASDPQYFGNLAPDGSWMIMKQNVAAGTMRFAVGTSDYATAWANRANLAYAYYDGLFRG